MPTGYTDPIRCGEVTDLRGFAWLCARAFGALIHVRDEPSSTEPPPLDIVSDHYPSRVDEARQRLRDLESMTTAEVRNAAAAHRARALAAWESREAERIKSRERYEAMLEQVQGWMPPTVEHEGLREFMIEQLTRSIEFDCTNTYDGRPLPVVPALWHEDQIAAARAAVERSVASLAAETERVARRNAWIKALRASLPEPT